MKYNKQLQKEILSAYGSLLEISYILSKNNSKHFNQIDYLSDVFQDLGDAIFTEMGGLKKVKRLRISPLNPVI